MDKIIVQNHDFFGGLWAVGWLFTVGYLKLAFWPGVVAIITWPYKIGVYLRSRMHHE